ncbi:FxLYD domain-containing protein [Streptomyces sp. NPDC048057]|uniref:FxLYD domain-containing protein n=1 Tax=Streptomyces sp. NPDC048057 TaxID=3155628 RepID=UPI0033C2A734
MADLRMRLPAGAPSLGLWTGRSTPPRGKEAYDMTTPWKRPAVSAALAALTATALAAGAAACSNGSPSETASSAASKAISAASSAVASVGAQATGAIASATASAQQKLDEIKGGVNAADDVALADQATKDGYATVKVTARNTADSTKSFAVQVNYRDASGNLLDAAVVTVSDVPAGQSKDATAQSNRKLSGEVKTEVGTAVRY